MDSYKDFRKSVKERHDFARWAGRSMTATSTLCRNFMPSHEMFSDFVHEERRPIPGGGHAFIDYFRHRADDEIRVAVTIKEHLSVEDAHEGLVDHLCDCMAPVVPTTAECGIAAGDVGFGGHRKMQTSVTFARFNILIKVECVGAKEFSVKEFAEEIDTHVLRHKKSPPSQER